MVIKLVGVGADLSRPLFLNWGWWSPKMLEIHKKWGWDGNECKKLNSMSLLTYPGNFLTSFWYYLHLYPSCKHEETVWAKKFKIQWKLLQCAHIDINYTNKGCMTCEEKQEMYQGTWPLFTSGYCSKSDSSQKLWEILRYHGVSVRKTWNGWLDRSVGGWVWVVDKF